MGLCFVPPTSKFTYCYVIKVAIITKDKETVLLGGVGGVIERPFCGAVSWLWTHCTLLYQTGLIAHGVRLKMIS